VEREGSITEKAGLGMTRNAWLATLTSFGGWTLVNMDGSFFTFTYPLIQRDLHITINQISYIYTFIYIVGAITTLVAGPLLDYWSRKAVFQVTLLATALGSLLSGLGWNFGSMLAFRSITQLGASAEWMSGQVMVAETTPSKVRGWWVGFAQIGWPVGWFLGSLIAFLVVPAWGWRWLFVIGVIPALFVIWVRRSVEEPERFKDMQELRKKAREVAAKKGEALREAAAEVATEFQVAKDKAVQFTYRQLFASDLARTSILIFLWQVIYNYGAGAIISWLPAVFLFYKVPLVNLYEASAWATGIAVLGYLSAAALGERFGRREISVLYLVIGAISGYMLAFHANNFASITVYYSGYYFFTIGQMGAAVAFALESFPTRARGTGGSLLAVATWIGFIAAGFTGPILMKAMGMAGAVALWTLVCSLIPAFLALGTKRVKPGRELEDIVV
jgi:MFS family permease